MRLTEQNVIEAKAGDCALKLWDDDGLYLLVQPNGSKIWRLKCHGAGLNRVLHFGRYPQISLEEARIRRDDALRAMAAGRDIWREIKESPVQTLKFEAIARTWHRDREHVLNPFYASRLMQRLELDIFPMLGGEIITRITPFQVLATLRKIEERGALTMALQLKRTVGKIFRYAMANGWAERDPTAGFSDALKPRVRTQHCRHVSFAEFPGFLRKVAAYEDLGRLYKPHIVREALILTILTWARTAEIRFATWDEFEDIDGPTPLWRVPTERMKMRQEHLVPLSRQAANLVRNLRQESRSKFLFAGRSGDRPISQNTMISACYRMGYRRAQTIHGLRGLASTWANEQQRYNADCIEMALSHHVADVRGAYNSALYLEPRRRLLQDWADTVARMGLFPADAMDPANLFQTHIATPVRKTLSFTTSFKGQFFSQTCK
ncbi:integrase arm-type DNA-binding domain-containing protein [Sphingobium phenoxybenzoativorans]|uniref:Integrase arm-type DNA-binding domain-containing protein n=1 Tax=Sphingobium phenoxybenzoativorans TaxID=1592790 RepID=A0A975K3U7_9SPHN|nr:integrase arm-type DNA-binding domain-containing protein [Sphingobium phenoxybenzoativorans]QUT04341.1 integrase arm-type DNA-binding domain-containing protein [Sphingobium phenoxybenzoativorans]